ncbi:hypothetical protein HID58_024215, partial [Brassica napus]
TTLEDEWNKARKRRDNRNKRKSDAYRSLERGERSDSPSGLSPAAALTLDPPSLFSSCDWGFLYLRSPPTVCRCSTGLSLSFSFSTLSFLLSSLDFRVSSDLIRDTSLTRWGLAGEPKELSFQLLPVIQSRSGSDLILPPPVRMVVGRCLSYLSDLWLVHVCLWVSACIKDLCSSSIDDYHGVQQQLFGGSSPHFWTLVIRLVSGYLTSSSFGVPEPLSAASVEAVGSHFRVR